MIPQHLLDHDVGKSTADVVFVDGNGKEHSLGTVTNVEDNVGEVLAPQCRDPIQEFSMTLTVGETEETPDDLLREGAETYQSKNEDYGDSWRTGAEFLSSVCGEVKLETDEDFVRFALLVRRLDKIVRAANEESSEGDPNYESLKDSHLDEMVYAAMHASTYDG